MVVRGVVRHRVNRFALCAVPYFVSDDMPTDVRDLSAKQGALEPGIRPYKGTTKKTRAGHRGQLVQQKEKQ